ncbi:hypothetical protein [Amycolatopsis sp. CA-126428]|uniref:hypothetical protein n=1 Tax=Amycolatopsis sp. CA-126428 TaxID=2073158 RepID=UPI000CD23444|nr:hypothetical protein [Amycolatopsis sp. CA-126428]
MTGTGIVATAGGAFDRSDTPIYFAAGESSAYPRHLLLAVNDLYHRSQELRMVRLLDEGHMILLDSGIFNLTNEHKRATGCSMDEALALPPDEIQGFDRLFDRYVELATKYEDRLWGYIELDQGGRENKIRTRARLHDLGLNPIPVYHPFNDGWDYFDDLARGYDRLCFGNVVQANHPTRVRLLHTMWERRRQYPHLWVHVLGLSACEWCLPCPPDSCDSSSWLNSLRYPAVRTESAALRRLGELGHRFLYSENANRDVACQMHADAMTHTLAVWRALQDRHADFGDDPYPARDDREGELMPS